jgi:glucosamine-6-phosphate deaminase
MAEVVIVPSNVEGGEIAATAIASLIAHKPDAVLGLATGSTPLTTWAALAARSLDLSRVRGFALDEYVGLPDGHPESYRAVITREVVEPLGLDPALVRVPGDDGPARGAGDRYEDAIHAAGGVDLQILGIGRTGHIGFNEPGSSLASLTRIKTLTQQTRLDNARFFDGNVDDVPMHCITQGLGTILRARHLVLLAWGPAKAAAIASALEGPVSASTPGSAVQLHPHVTVIVDEDAAASLEHADYYRYAWDNRHLVAD